MKKSSCFFLITVCLLFSTASVTDSFLCRAEILPEKAKKNSLKEADGKKIKETDFRIWIPANTTLLLEWQPARSAPGSKAEINKQFPPELNHFFPFLLTLGKMAENFQENRFHLKLDRILWGTFGNTKGNTSSGSRDFILLLGNFKPVHAEYISKYIYPGRFTIQKKEVDGKILLQVTETGGKNLLNTKEPVILYFPAPGLTVIYPESLWLQYHQQSLLSEKRSASPPYNPDFYEGISALPGNAGIKVFLNTETHPGPLAVNNSFSGIYAALNNADQDSLFKITVLLSCPDKNTADRNSAEIKKFIDSVYTNAVRQGVSLSTQLTAHTFSVKTDAADRVRIDIQMPPDQGQIFLQQFFQALQQNL